MPAAVSSCAHIGARAPLRAMPEQPASPASEATIPLAHTRIRSPPRRLV
ncbi:hypothetical protein ACFOPN_10050 [Xanthomonas hyacinthi]